MAGVTLRLRQRLLPVMAHVAAQIQADVADAIRAFRQVHSMALPVNLVQLIALVWGITRLSL